MERLDASLVAAEDAELVAFQNDAHEAWLADIEPDTGPLSAMVDQALRMWPAIAYTSKRGNRAQSAATLVKMEAVRHLGGDQWEVTNHLCTNLTCDCEDRAPIDHLTGGKLCKHCIAVRMTLRLQVNERLIAALRALAGGRVEVLIERDYEDRQRVVSGYRSKGHDIRWPAGERIPVTFEQMRYALGVLGWSLNDLPLKWQRWDYLWRLRTDDTGTPLTAAIWQMKGVTDGMLERRTNVRLANWAAGEFAAAA